MLVGGGGLISKSGYVDSTRRQPIQCVSPRLPDAVPQHAQWANVAILMRARCSRSRNFNWKWKIKAKLKSKLKWADNFLIPITDMCPALAALSSRILVYFQYFQFLSHAVYVKGWTTVFFNFLKDIILCH